ncbi:MAG: hypothetical protein DDT33_01739 [Firmicutes bacterium]|nr:hypothetical protein [Bacillota bacterium]
MIVGHFRNLAEAQKLVQSVLLAGVIQEIYEEGQLLQKLPVVTINSRSIIYNRERSLPSAAQYAINQQIPWTSDVEYAAQVEVDLKRTARQDVLDNFIMKTYKSPNDYRSIVLSQLRKGCMRTIEDMIIYGNGIGENTTGLNRLLPVTGGETFATTQAFDMGGAANGLSLAILRDLIDAVKPKPDFLLMTRALRNRLSQAQFERGISSTTMGLFQLAKDDFGALTTYFSGIPIMVSDYMTTEVDNTGAKLGTGNLVSIWALRLGQIEDGGLVLVTGGDTGGVDFFQMVNLEALEDFDAEGIRLVAYWNLALGSTKAIGRIHSINQTVAVTA